MKYFKTPHDLCIPVGTEAILDEYAYENNTDLETADIRGALYVGPYCFMGCENLEVVTIGPSIESISELAFLDSGLQEIIFDGTPEELEKFKDYVDMFRDEWINDVPITCLKA